MPCAILRTTNWSCPSGKQLYGNSSNYTFNGIPAIKFQGAKQDSQHCNLRHQCLRTPDKTSSPLVVFFLGKAPGDETYTDRKKAKIGSGPDKAMITRRFPTVEPVFAK